MFGRALRIALRNLRGAMISGGKQQAVGGHLIYPMYTENSLYIKRCTGWSWNRSCFRVATHIGRNSKYHGSGTRYYCAGCAPHNAVEITDAMLRGAIRQHNCHITAAETEALCVAL